MLFGYDAPRIHAALNDLPPALLTASVVFDLLGVWLKRESLKAAGFWTLISGVLGAGAAIVSGLVAEDAVQHSDQAHAIMETHETLAFIVLGIFGILAIWRILRRGVWREKEQPVALTAGVIGVAILVYAAMLGGKLIFDHGLGIPSSRLEGIVGERGGHEHEEGDSTGYVPGAAATQPADTSHAHPAPADTSKR